MEFKGTRGEVIHEWNGYYNEIKIISSNNNKHVRFSTLIHFITQNNCIDVNGKDEDNANANLIVDAFKVRQQINCELSELLEQRNEMLGMLEDIVLGIRGEVFMPTTSEIEQLIKKAKL